MNLTEEDFKLSAEIVEKCLSLEDILIDDFIKESIRNYIKLNIILTKLEDRNKLYEFLCRICNLFKNICINGQAFYLLNKDEEDKAGKCMEITSNIIVKFRSEGINKLL